MFAAQVPVFQRVVLEALEVDRRSVYNRRREQLHLALSIFRLAIAAWPSFFPTSSFPVSLHRPLYICIFLRYEDSSGEFML